MGKTIVMITAFVAVVSAQVPHTFEAGTVAKAGEVNTNFSYLMGRIDSLIGIVDTMTGESDSLEARIAVLETSELPIGAVVGTMAPMDTSSEIWVLADGRPATLEYLNATGNNTVPDFRGMFLRGLNEGRADGKEDPEGAGRVAGSYQTDSLKAHNHAVTRYQSGGSKNGWVITIGVHDYETNNTGTSSSGGSETRARNMAVYWYVKVK